MLSCILLFLREKRRKRKNGDDVVQPRYVYVLSDVHNDVIKLAKMLKIIDFDNEKDALYVLGDIFDRGEYPLQTYELIRTHQFQGENDLSPGIHCVKGNHDSWLAKGLAAYLSGQSASSFFNSLDIILNEAEDSKVMEILGWIMALPYQIELEYDSPYGRKRYLLAHGMTELPRDKYWRVARYFTMADDLDFAYIKQGIPGYVSLIGHNSTDNIREWIGEDERPTQTEIYFNRKEDPSVIAVDCGCGLNNLGRKRKSRLACIRLNDYRCYYVD